MKYTHIIFDIDGTLLDTFKTGIGSLQKTLREELGIEQSFEQLEKYFGIPSFKTVEEFPFKDKKEALDIWEENYQNMMEYIVPFEGIDEMLDTLFKMGKKIGILTSRSKMEFHRDNNLERWLHYFDYVITSADSQRFKPFPDPMFAYLKKSGAKADECLYVGDTIFDYNCAHDAGVDFTLVDWKGIAPKEILYEYKVKSIKNLIDTVSL